MAEPCRPTAEDYMTPITATDKPFPGQKCWVLTHGGRCVEHEWKNGDEKYYDAYRLFPKVPQEVKDLQFERFSKTGRFAPPEEA